MAHRVEILNQRLDVVHELFSMLSDELNQKHNAKLEWIIIWLILIEVIVGLVSLGMTFLQPASHAGQSTTGPVPVPPLLRPPKGPLKTAELTRGFTKCADVLRH